jgi:nitrogen fixation-related uncharacterized protein
MDPDLMFRLGNLVALAGWVALLASPWLPVISDRIAATLIPVLLAVAYVAVLLAFWSRGQGGFDTLDNVALLFGVREMVLAGWLHFLAFDLFIGAWETRTARAERIPFLLVLPCLAATFLFGPAGFLLFTAIRVLRHRMQPV